MKICFIHFTLSSASLVIANEDDFAHERNYLHLARSVRSIGEVGPRRRGGGIAVDRDNRRQGDTQRGGSTGNRGNSSGGRRGAVPFCNFRFCILLHIQIKLYLTCRSPSPLFRLGCFRIDVRKQHLILFYKYYCIKIVFASSSFYM